MQTVIPKFLCSISRIHSNHWYGITEFFQMLMLATVVFGSNDLRRLRESEEDLVVNAGTVCPNAKDVTLFSQLEVFVNTYLKQLTICSIPNLTYSISRSTKDDQEKAIESFQERYPKDIVAKMLFVPIFGKYADQLFGTFNSPQQKKSKTKIFFGTSLKFLGAALKICVGIVGFQPGNLVEGFKEAVEFFHSMSHLGEGYKKLHKIISGPNEKLGLTTELEIVTQIAQKIQIFLRETRIQVRMHGLSDEERTSIRSVKENSIEAWTEVQKGQADWIEKASKKVKGLREVWGELYNRKMQELSWKSDLSPYELMSLYIGSLEKRVLALERMNGIKEIIKIPDQIQVKLPRL